MLTPDPQASPATKADTSPDTRAVWTDDRLDDPHRDEEKAARVHAMFDAIAASYDLNNRVHSLWRDQAWRRKAVALTRIRAALDDVVDVACGTGDLTLAFAEARPKSVRGVDFVPRMIEIARHKTAQRFGPAGTDPETDSEVAPATTAADADGSTVGIAGVPEPPRPTFAVGDAMALDLPDDCADVVSIAFGIRNVTDPAQAIREFHRILRPGGRLLILEFSLPRHPVLRYGYEFYFNHIMPRTATLLSRDRTGAYRYLPRSVSTFLDRDQLVGMMDAAGFVRITQHPLTFGICVAYLGHRA